MESFIAKLVYQISNAKKEVFSQFDVSVRLIMAHDEREAFRKAIEVGRIHQSDFVDVEGNKVRWIFIGVAEVERAGEFSHGQELYSHIRVQENSEAYIEYVHSLHHRNQRVFSEPMEINVV